MGNVLNKFYWGQIALSECLEWEFACGLFKYCSLGRISIVLKNNFPSVHKSLLLSQAALLWTRH